MKQQMQRRLLLSSEDRSLVDQNTENYVLFIVIGHGLACNSYLLSNAGGTGRGLRMSLDSEAALNVRMATFKEEEETGTLLYYASKGNIPILKHTLDNGTSMDVADYDGRTALDLAVNQFSHGSQCAVI